MIKKLDHVSLVVKDVEEAAKLYKELLGLGTAPVEDVPDQGVKVMYVPIGDSHIEFIQPVREDTGVARFLKDRGEGLHHICFEVDNVDKELPLLEAKGVQLIDKKARSGVAGMIAFLHPRSTKGTLIELCHKVRGHSH